MQHADRVSSKLTNLVEAFSSYRARYFPQVLVESMETGLPGGQKHFKEMIMLLHNTRMRMLLPMQQ